MNDQRPKANGDWNEWRRLVLSELDDHGRGLDAIRAQLTSIEINIGILKGKAALAGAAMGAIVGAAMGAAFRLL